MFTFSFFKIDPIPTTRNIEETNIDSLGSMESVMSKVREIKNIRYHIDPLTFKKQLNPYCAFRWMYKGGVILRLESILNFSGKIDIELVNRSDVNIISGESLITYKDFLRLYVQLYELLSVVLFLDEKKDFYTVKQYKKEILKC